MGHFLLAICLVYNFKGVIAIHCTYRTYIRTCIVNHHLESYSSTLYSWYAYIPQTNFPFKSFLICGCKNAYGFYSTKL